MKMAVIRSFISNPNHRKRRRVARKPRKVARSKRLAIMAPRYGLASFRFQTFSSSCGFFVLGGEDFAPEQLQCLLRGYLLESVAIERVEVSLHHCAAWTRQSDENRSDR